MQREQMKQRETQMLLSAIVGTLGAGAIAARPALNAYNVKQSAKNVKDLKSLNWDFMEQKGVIKRGLNTPFKIKLICVLVKWL